MKPFTARKARQSPKLTVITGVPLTVSTGSPLTVSAREQRPRRTSLQLPPSALTALPHHIWPSIVGEYGVYIRREMNHNCKNVEYEFAAEIAWEDEFGMPALERAALEHQALIDAQDDAVLAAETQWEHDAVAASTPDEDLMALFDSARAVAMARRRWAERHNLDIEAYEYALYQEYLEEVRTIWAGGDPPSTLYANLQGVVPWDPPSPGVIVGDWKPEDKQEQDSASN